MFKEDGSAPHYSIAIERPEGQLEVPSNYFSSSRSITEIRSQLLEMQNQGLHAQDPERNQMYTGDILLDNLEQGLFIIGRLIAEPDHSLSSDDLEIILSEGNVTEAGGLRTALVQAVGGYTIGRVVADRPSNPEKSPEFWTYNPQTELFIEPNSNTRVSLDQISKDDLKSLAIQVIHGLHRFDRPIEEKIMQQAAELRTRS